MDLGIVIPCFNEYKRLVFSDFEKFINQKNEIYFCFVNDGSKDKTITVLKKINQINPNRVHIIDLKKNFGKSEAVRVGMNFFLLSKKVKKIAYLDADLSTSLEECFALSKKINLKTKFIFASRIKKIDNNIERYWYRFIIGRILATIISKILNLSVYDTQCGCKVFNSELIPIAFGSSFVSRWLFDVEIFFRLKNHFGAEKLKYFSEETPLNSWIDFGDSKIKLSYCIVVWFDLLKIYRTYR
jgi:glycosyltransferase involved in cell wall biosynthesis